MFFEQKNSDLGNVSLAYYDILPKGEEKGIILLLHGFASTAQINWLSSSWAQTLTDQGYRVIAPCHRGHGNSTKFYSPDDYGPDIFAADTFALLNHLRIEQCDVMGYSMGARIACWMAHEAPDRFKRVIFGGMGIHIFGSKADSEVLAEGLETETPELITDERAAAFRRFADRTDSDRFALAACIRPSLQKITVEMVQNIHNPVLVAVGSTDEIGGSPIELADLMPNAEGYLMPGLDHMKATGAQVFKQKVLSFLQTIDA